MKHAFANDCMLFGFGMYKVYDISSRIYIFVFSLDCITITAINNAMLYQYNTAVM